MKYLLLIIFFLSTVASADSSHHGSQTSSDKVSMTAGISTTFRNNSLSEDTLWQIPGILMGGDSHPTEEGISLDEASVELEWKSPESVFAGFELSQHGDHNIEFEQAFAGLDILMSEQVQSSLNVGRIKARFSPENGTHASARLFSENNVIYDAFYGGAYVDEGARFEIHSNDIIFGTEFWKGRQFPSTAGSDGGAQDVYVYWNPSIRDWKITFGAWFFRAKADSRKDDRADDSHQHSNSATSIADLTQFKGRHLISGVHGSFIWEPDSNWKFRSSFEIQKVNVDGELSDATRLAKLEGRYTGIWIQPELHFQRHELALRYARLKLDIHVVGPASQLLIEDSGLKDIGRDPDCLGISYGYQLFSNLRLRLEWTRNRTTSNTEHYAGIGLRWRSDIL